MSLTEKRAIFFTNDLDGVHFTAPPPLKTVLELLKGNLKIPAVDRPLGEYPLPNGLTESILRRLSILSHQIRPFIPEALEGLGLFKGIAEDYHRQIQFAALSGREVDKHQMTTDVLSRTGHMKYFDNLFLNQGRSASRWKESIVTQLIADGFNVVHIDDDIRAGLCVARVDQRESNKPRVLVYLIRNISNHPYLLYRAKIILPPNVILVRSFKNAAEDFAQKLEQKYI